MLARFCFFNTFRPSLAGPGPDPDTSLAVFLSVRPEGNVRLRVTDTAVVPCSGPSELAFALPTRICVLPAADVDGLVVPAGLASPPLVLFDLLRCVLRLLEMEPECLNSELLPLPVRFSTSLQPASDGELMERTVG